MIFFERGRFDLPSTGSTHSLSANTILKMRAAAIVQKHIKTDRLCNLPVGLSAPLHIRINTVDHTIEINGKADLRYEGELFMLHPGINRIVLHNGSGAAGRVYGTVSYCDLYV